MKTQIGNINLNFRSLFLIDAAGAFVSAFLLGVVLVQFERFIGMPKETLHLLAAIPIPFILYDLICFFFIKDKWRLALKIIAIANLAYCGISIAMLIKHVALLTVWGWAYFIIEIIIVALIAILELRVAKVISL